MLYFVKIYSGYSVWVKFEKREIACDIIYRPPSQDGEFLLNSLTIVLDYFTNTYDNYLIMRDFNLEPHDKRLGYLLNNTNLQLFS